MIDKIQPGVPSGYTNSVNPIEGKTGSLAESPQRVDKTSAEVNLSEDAKSIQRIMQAVQDSPEVRADVVQAIQKQIEAGTYNVNTESLAEKLLPFLK
jgi:flagellar biosynthesis anti-sigma factor FlgM